MTTGGEVLNKNVGLRAHQNAKLQKQNRKEAEALRNHAMTAFRQGQHTEAQTLCQRALQLLPDDFDATHLLAMSKLECKEYDDAEQLLKAAIRINSKVAEVHSNLGVAMFEMKRYEEAKRSYDRAIALRPNYPIAINNRGNALLSLKRYDEALAGFERAIALKPDYVDAYHNRGMLMLLIERHEEALASFERAISFRPRHAEALAGKGLTQSNLRQFDDALTSLTKALSIRPEFPDALVHLAIVHTEMMNSQEATANLEAALAIDPKMEAAWIAKAHFCLLTQQIRDAITCCERALEIDPDSAKALSYLGQCYSKQGNIAAAIENFDRALSINPSFEGAISGKLFSLDFAVDADFGVHQAVRRFWWEQIGARHPRFQHDAAARSADASGRRIRVGYVSSDFRNHSAAKSFMPILRHHDHAAFEIVSYSCSREQNETTDECRQISDRFVDAASFSDKQLAEQILADKIDILVDLSGHSAGHRLCVFARKPAPVQVTAWGHCTGTGMATMDYLFSDPIATPADVRHLFAEKIYDLPCLITMEPTIDNLRPTAPPMLSRGHVTFGVFNRIDKISDQALAVWGRIFDAMPTARMVVKHGALDDDFLKAALIERFIARGLSRERVDFVGSTTRAEHLLAFEGVDMSLDPFPQNGGVSTWESLQRGVPVLAQLGNSIPSRVAGAIVSSIGLDNWLARDHDAYVALALQYAAMPDYLTALRSELPARIEASAAGNGKLYTEHVEQAYRAFWRDYGAGAVS